jgi:FixJ family two-component response regulator
VRPLVSIVDDDPSVREGVADLVETFGFKTQAFANAQEFLSAQVVSSTCCLIADMQMPGMSGLDLYDTLTSLGKAVPTVLITAFPNETIRKRAISAGVVCCLSKPFSDIDLLECIRSAVPDRSPSSTEP